MEISNPQEIRIDDYNYALPDNRIAKYPLAKRDSSKLLVYRKGQITDASFSDLPNYLPSDSLLVFNNTKVIQARLHFTKSTGAQIEIFCLEPYYPNDYILNFQQTKQCSWVCLIGNLKKWKEGCLEKKFLINGREILIQAQKKESSGDSHIVTFEWNDSDIVFSDILEAVGELPIPPYLNRDTEEEDKETYQTVYSKIKGSVAAPTAGLHFTPQVFESLEGKGIQTAEVTLHVGAGTFRPVKAEKIKHHEMHAEFISVHKEFIQRLSAHQGKVIAVGTTSVRTIESLYYIGELLEKEAPATLKVSQWQPYQENSNQITVQKSLSNILNHMEANSLQTIVADTRIIITPGYTFKIVDGIVTNFHQPQSTLLLLVSAFVADTNWKLIYQHALDNDYRFLSYGDSSLLLKE